MKFPLFVATVFALTTTCFAGSKNDRPHWTLQIGPNTSARQLDESADPETQRILKDQKKIMKAALKRGVDPNSVLVAG
jgi:hypothetical protein